MGTGSGFGGTVALGTPWWPQVVALGVRRWLWGQVAALGAPWWPHVVALGGSEDGYGDRQWLWGHGGLRWWLLGVGRWLWGQVVPLGARWLWGHLGGPRWWLWGGQEMAMGTGGGFGDRQWLWGTVAPCGGSGGVRRWLWGQAVALGARWLWGWGGCGCRVALRTGGGTIQAEVPAVPPSPSPSPHQEVTQQEPPGCPIPPPFFGQRCTAGLQGDPHGGTASPAPCPAVGPNAGGG